jgi:hypothetical protein
MQRSLDRTGKLLGRKPRRRSRQLLRLICRRRAQFSGLSSPAPEALEVEALLWCPTGAEGSPSTVQDLGGRIAGGAFGHQRWDRLGMFLLLFVWSVIVYFAALRPYLEATV